ncbi:MAG: hypothetical protein LBH35_04315 [Treponema sp.]|jgi:hypothetical protein|nr:hypothetical protein [Treponema sp.]
MRKLLFMALITTAGMLAAQSQVLDMDAALRNGDVSLTASGNGSSSGASVEGYLQNNRTVIIRISIVISGGIYLKNSGSAQNMVATQVYLADGGYYIENDMAFIELAPRSRTEIMLIAFCADFELDNPSPNDSFSRGSMPSALQAITAKVSRFMADHPDEDIVTAAQLAVWLARGETLESISEKFDFTSDDVVLARRIMAY